TGPSMSWKGCLSRRDFLGAKKHLMPSSVSPTPWTRVGRRRNSKMRYVVVAVNWHHGYGLLAPFRSVANALQVCESPRRTSYGTASMMSATTRRTAPSLGLDAAAISRHQTVNVLASSGVSATWYESPPTMDGPRSAVSSARTMLEGRADPEALSSLLRSMINPIARNVSDTALPDGITTGGWTSTTPRSRPIAGKKSRQSSR